MAEVKGRNFVRLILLIVSLMISAGSVAAKPWRGIVPLHSNCEDVKRLLGYSSCKADSYDLDAESVFILFSEKQCDGYPIKWNVPIGTVLSIDISPKVKPRLSDIIGDRNCFNQTRDQHLPNIVYYTNKEEGLTLLALPNGDVGGFFYGPTAKDLSLRCSDGPTDEFSEGAAKFDEYGKLPFTKERIRLAHFARQLREQPSTTGYIIVHSLGTQPNEGRARASRAKKYLVKNQGIPDERIIVVERVDAKTSIIELYIAP